MSGLPSPTAHIGPPLLTVRVADVPAQPWRNGGGRTREVLAWPAGPAWKLRISVADIDADGPFSAFPGVQRWFAVLEGAGVVLTFPDGKGDRPLTVASEPLCFDGAQAPGCRLIDGPTRDLNLMLRPGARGCLVPVKRDLPWSEPWPWRACFTTGAARWLGGGGRVVDLEANTLLCDLGPGACRVVASDAALPAFWLGVDAGLSENAA